MRDNFDQTKWLLETCVELALNLLPIWSYFFGNNCIGYLIALAAPLVKVTMALDLVIGSGFYVEMSTLFPIFKPAIDRGCFLLLWTYLCGFNQQLVHEIHIFLRNASDDQTYISLANRLNYGIWPSFVLYYGWLLYKVVAFYIHKTKEKPEVDCQLKKKASSKDLQYACSCGNLATVKKILKEADKDDLTTLLNEQDDDLGNTALHLACIGRHASVIETLLASDLDLTIVNKANHTALDIAIQLGSRRMVAALLKKVQSSSLTKTHLMTALEGDYNDVVRILTENMKDNGEIFDDTFKREMNRYLGIDQLIDPAKKGKKREHLVAKQNKSKATLLKMLKGEEDSVTDLAREYECPICFHIMAPPTEIYACLKDHMFCGQHKDMLEECPICREAFSEGNRPVRNTMYEEVAKRLALSSTESEPSNSRSTT